MRSVTAITGVALFYGSSKTVPTHGAARQLTTPFPHSAPRNWNHRPPARVPERPGSLCASKRAVLLKRDPHVAEPLGLLMLQRVHPVPHTKTGRSHGGNFALPRATQHANRPHRTSTTHRLCCRDFRPLNCSHVS